MYELLSFLDDYTVDSQSSKFPEELDLPFTDLLHYVRQLDEEQAKKISLDTQAIAHYQPVLKHLYALFIHDQEIKAVQLDVSEPQEDKAFANDAYNRVKDMFDRIDFARCKQFVMVGCGPLPVTLLHILKKTAIPNVIGLDADYSAVALNLKQLQKQPEERLSYIHTNGSEYNYANTPVIYIANLVSPKEWILKRIAETAPNHASVILRDPYAMGFLFAEKGIDVISDAFEVTGEGDGNSRFLSKHIFLKLNK